MRKKFTDINDLVVYLAALTAQSVLSNDIWKCYGYNKRPKHGAILHKLFPNRFNLENHIIKSVLIMSLIDIFNGIKKSDIEYETKLLISIGIIDNLNAVIQPIVKFDTFLDTLLLTYKAASICEKHKLYEPILSDSQSHLDKKDFARFMVGTINLLGSEVVNDFIINSDTIKTIINQSSSDKELILNMPTIAQEHYLSLLTRFVYH
jgi:hypothetical protein